MTAAGQAAIQSLMEQKLFDTESDAYKVGIAYAIAAGLKPEKAPSGGYSTKFNAVGGVDNDGRVRDLIGVLGVGERGRPYATAERLAELGVTAIAERLREMRLSPRLFPTHLNDSYGVSAGVGGPVRLYHLARYAPALTDLVPIPYGPFANFGELLV